MLVTALEASLHDERVDIASIAEQLDAMDGSQREAALSDLDRADQRRLYEKAARAPMAGIGDFVPEGLAPLEAVHHFGKNTLPLPKAHRFFEKRFCRASDGSQRLFGYNHSPSRKLIGPGYFVAYVTEGHENFAPRGGVVIDYFQVPDGPVCPDWPSVVPNSRKLQRFVFQGTRDFMRRVSKHVSVGAAYKGEKPLDHYFVLCRRDR